MDWTRLTACQQAAADGDYATALSGFLKWAASRYERIRGNLAEESPTLRGLVQQEGMHKRTPEMVKDLLLGLRWFLVFAHETGAILSEEGDALLNRCCKAIQEAASAQELHRRASDPVERFFELLTAALASGKAHVASCDGSAPTNPEAWGWRNVPSQTFVLSGGKPKGERIGWVDGDDLYLEPNSSFGVAQRLANDTGESLAIAGTTLRKRLNERGLLRSTEQTRGHLTVRRSLDGVRRAVLHLHSRSLMDIDTEAVAA